jgi:HSP20 family protein
MNKISRNLTPLDELTGEMERMFDSLLGRTVGSVLRSSSSGANDRFVPQLDIAETPSEYVVSVDLPGIKPDDVKIELDDGLLTISGSRESCKHEDKRNFHRVERSSGSFQRMVTLPREIEADRIEANYDQGVLHVTLPKSAAKQPRKIEIKTAN